MFTHLLPNNDTVLLKVVFSQYSQRHFLKEIEKKYSRKIWNCTVESILQDLSRICISSSDLQRTQQVDELWHSGNSWIFKYDFRVAGTKTSTKASGNRCIVYVDISRNYAEILMLYDKGCLPKNQGETAYIHSVLINEFGEYWERCRN